MTKQQELQLLASVKQIAQELAKIRKLVEIEQRPALKEMGIPDSVREIRAMCDSTVGSVGTFRNEFEAQLSVLSQSSSLINRSEGI